MKKIDTQNIITEMVNLIINYKINEYKIYNKSNSLAETNNLMADLTKEFKDNILDLINDKISD